MFPAQEELRDCREAIYTVNRVRVLQRELYRAAKAQKERRFGVANADAGWATFRETCMGRVGYTDYGGRCFDMGLNADRRNLSESRVKENFMHGSMRGGWKHGMIARNGLRGGDLPR